MEGGKKARSSSTKWSWGLTRTKMEKGHRPRMGFLNMQVKMGDFSITVEEGGAKPRRSREVL